MNKLSSLFTGILFVMLSVTYSYTQEVKPGLPNELDNKFNPSKSGVFKAGEGSSSAGSGSSSYGAEYKNVIKSHIGLFARSIAAFSYQRFLSDQISVEASLGLAYNRDYIYALFGSEIDAVFSSSNQKSAFSPNDLYTRGVKDGTGAFWGTAVKFHYESLFSYSDRLSYFELGIRGYSNKLNLKQVYDTYSEPALIGNTHVKINHTNYYMAWGTIFSTEGKIKTVHEFYLGMGLRKVSYLKWVEEPNNGYSGGYQYQYRATNEKESSVSILMTIGYNFGIGW